MLVDAGSRGEAELDCAASGSEPSLGLSGSRTRTEVGQADKFPDRRPSPFTGGRVGISAACLDPSRAGSCLVGIVRTVGQARRSNQARCTVASVEQMESHFQKKPCTPASKSARTCSRRDGHGLNRCQGWMWKSWYSLTKPGHRPACRGVVGAPPGASVVSHQHRTGTGRRPPLWVRCAAKD